MVCNNKSASLLLHPINHKPRLLRKTGINSCGQNHALLRRLARNHTFARCLVAVQRYATNRGLGFRLDFLLGFRSPVPVAEQEAAFLDFLFKLFVRIDFAGKFLAMLESLLIYVGLDILQRSFTKRAIPSSGSTCFSRVSRRISSTVPFQCRVHRLRGAQAHP